MPTRNWRAAGLDVKNDRSTSFCATVAGALESPVLVALATAAVDRIERNCAITASFRAFSCFSERFNFLVSCNFLRWIRIVSGVGSSGEGVNWRFYNKSTSDQCPGRESYLVMLQPHPRHQVLRDRENIPQHVDLKLIIRLIDRGFKQRLQLV